MPPGSVHTIDEFVGGQGKIVPARGPTTFGKSVRRYSGFLVFRTAEMPKEEKNKISHRGKALEKLVEWLKQEA